MKYRNLKKGQILRITDEFQRENKSWGFLADCATFEPNEKVGDKVYKRKYRREVSKSKKK